MTAELQASRRNNSLILTLANPGRHNAADRDMLAAALETLSKAERNDDIHNVIITGAEQDFCAGVTAARDQASQLAALDNLHNLIDMLRSFPKPVIAAIEGQALDGGLSLVLACDLAVAGQSAQFGISPAQAGYWTIGGAIWLLQQSLPATSVNELLLSKQPWPAARLHQLGLLNRIVTDATALEQALAWAEQLSTVPAAAFERLKNLPGNTSASALNQHFAWEKQVLLSQRASYA